MGAFNSIIYFKYSCRISDNVEAAAAIPFNFSVKHFKQFSCFDACARLCASARGFARRSGLCCTQQGFRYVTRRLLERARFLRRTASSVVRLRRMPPT
jgi:hypothetical protein